jgi:hypothetical protein
MATMSTPSLASEPVSADPGYRAWLTRLEEMVRDRLGVGLEAFGALPLRDGYEVGDTAAEFYAGAIADLAVDFGLER